MFKNVIVDDDQIEEYYEYVMDLYCYEYISENEYIEIENYN